MRWMPRPTRVRLEVFVTLVEAGPSGLSADTLATTLGVAHNALSFYLTG